jgi:hypothetical protein
VKCAAKNVTIIVVRGDLLSMHRGLDEPLPRKEKADESEE